MEGLTEVTFLPLAQPIKAGTQFSNPELVNPVGFVTNQGGNKDGHPSQ